MIYSRYHSLSFFSHSKIEMNILNDLNIPPDPPETWQAKLGRLFKDYVLPYGVPYVIPLVLGKTN